MKKKIHYNKPQLRSILVGAPSEVLIAGRGTGKTEGVQAYKTSQVYVKTMPRSIGVNIAATYNQILMRTLPSLRYGWEKIGYLEDVHYIVGKKPPEKWIKMWNWKGPHRQPKKWDYFISWYNGAGCHMVSQDIKGSSNGITIDWIHGDEVKFLNKERLDEELLPANRGIIPEFEGNPYHHGITFTTDMPTGTGGRWLLEMESMMDKEKVQKILDRQRLIYLIKQQCTTKAKQKLQQHNLAILEAEIIELRHGLMYFHEASTLENIHALGIDYIKDLKQRLTQHDFNTSILNMRAMRVEDGFYPDFNEEDHGYFGADTDYLQRYGIADFHVGDTVDCLKDGDLNEHLPLHIAIDYNRRINPLVVGQDLGNEIRILNALHVLYPEKLKHVVKKFIDYYKPLKNKTVYYWYDQTAASDQLETRQCDEVISQLRQAGWVVIPMYTRSAPLHRDKYNMYGHLLTEDGYYSRRLRVNRENCPDLITSINQSPAEMGKDGFQKNKTSEKDPKFPAQESTHYSDTLDMLVWGLLESKVQYVAMQTGGIIMG